MPTLELFRRLFHIFVFKQTIQLDSDQQFTQASWKKGMIAESEANRKSEP